MYESGSAFQQGIGRVARQYWSGDRITPSAEHQAITFQIGMVMDDADDQKAGRLWVYFPYFSGVKVREADPTGSLARGRSIDANSGEAHIDPTDRGTWILCYPMLPFFGSDSFRQGGSESTTPGRNARQGQSNSYGLWFQPRIGDYVGALFANGDPHQAFWIGCVPKPNENFMVPGHAGESGDGDNPEFIPAHEKPSGDDTPRVESQEFAQNLRQAGLQRDVFRGAGTSSAVRESPSYVTGLKSAGWAYDSEKELPIGAGNAQPFKTDAQRYSQVNTMGHQLVMDDHPDFQALRLRSSKGSQILFNDVDDYIYINTARGNVWMQFGDDGTLNLYTKGSISTHTEGDYNLTVGGNFNLQVEQNATIGVKGKTTALLSDTVKLFTGLAIGLTGPAGFYWDHLGSVNATIGGAVKANVLGQIGLSTGAGFTMQTAASFDLLTGTGFSVTAGTSVNVLAGTGLNATAGVDVNILAAGMAALTGTGMVSIGSVGTTFIDGSFVALGTPGPFAVPAFPALPTTPAIPGIPPLIGKTWGPPSSAQIASGDEPDKLIYIGSTVPQHEPWLGHPKTTRGTNGQVEYNSQFVKSLRRGATSATAKAPTSYVAQDGTIKKGRAYATNNAGEAPQYDDAGNVDPSQLAPANSYHISDEGKDFIKSQEGFSATPYPDAGGYSIGYGNQIHAGDTIGDHTVTQDEMNRIARGEKNVLTIDRDTADNLFDQKVQKYESAVQKSVTAPMTQGQYDAMTSLAYNVGPGNLQKSQMVQKFNSGDTPGAINEFMGFNKSQGRVLPVLQQRRQAEIDKLFTKGADQSAFTS